MMKMRATLLQQSSTSTPKTGMLKRSWKNCRLSSAVEQLFCKQQVVSPNLTAGSGQVVEWSITPRCRRGGLAPSGVRIPPCPLKFFLKNDRRCSSAAEQLHGKE